MGTVVAVLAARERIAERDQDIDPRPKSANFQHQRPKLDRQANRPNKRTFSHATIVQEFEFTQTSSPGPDELEEQGSKLTPEEYLENWIKNTGEKEISRREWVLKEIKEKCVEEKENVMHYKNLFGFLLFAALYLAILVCQRQSNASFEISRLLYEYLPEQTNDGDVVQPFTGWGEVISYLNENIIQEVWKDSTCGDGSCVGPFEYVSWGLASNLHGCYNDCGSIKELTNVAVHLDYTTASQGLLAAKLSLGAEGLETPQPVEWNVCTRRVNKLVEECWFSTAQTLQPGHEIQETLQLPDDQWYLKIEKDSRYLRGSLTAESPVGRSCALNCSTPVCSYDCVEGGNITAQGGTEETSLFNFEMCAYDAGPDSTLTWRDYEFDGPCEDYALRLSSYPVGHIQVSINHTWVEVCPWAIDYYVTHIAEINTVCRSMGYDDGEGVEWTTSDRPKFFAGSCNALETPGFCTASDEQYRNLIITAGQCPWSYSVRCSGNKSPATCKNDNADSSTLQISTLEPITSAWFYLGEAVEDGAAEDNTAGGSCAASDTTPPATDGDSVASGTCSTEPIPCIASLHFDTTRCLILYHHYDYTCSETVEDLVNQVGICAPSASLESLLLDGGLTANTTIGEVCPSVCCSSLEECAGLGLLRLAGSSGPGRRTPYSWEGRLEVWTTDHSANYSGWTAVFASRDWQYESATMACHQMGYDSVLTSDLRLATTSKYVSGDVYKSYWPAEAGVNRQTGKANSRLAVKRCAGTETSFLQCPMEDWWGFDTPRHALKTNISDVFGVSQVFGTGSNITWWDFFESGVSVVNLQCHKASAAVPPIYEDVCGGGECCSSKCLSFKNPAYKWDTVECVYNDLECFDKQACRDENMCVGDIAMRANQVCNADCNNAACRMDDWDCCAPGEIFDLNSGFETSCCQPTSFAPGNKYSFDLDAHPEIDYAGASAKWVRSLNSNNLVAGMIIHQTRSFLTLTPGPVNDSHYFTQSGSSLEEYGRNPYFLSTSSMYDPDLKASDYYTAEEMDEDAGDDGCYAFTHYTMPGFRDGFPVVLSDELDENQVQELVKYMVDGSFVDQQTESLKAHLVFYNAPSGQFANLVLDFTMVNGGGILFKYKVQPMDMETYQSQADYFRLAAEIVFICMLIFSLFNESMDGYRAGFKEHFSSLWNTCDMISISLNLACCAIWIYMNWYSTYRLNIQNVYDIYPHPERQPGRLTYDHDQLKELADQFTKVTQIGNMYSQYMSLCGINIMLFLFRIFKLLDFQPRVGILTRTICKALNDLLHFAFVLILTFIVYATLGYVIFGPTIQRFSTFIGSSSTVFNMMLGEFADAHADLFDASHDSGLLIFPAYLFFYSFMCIVFLVMLNFLLAIIVDAFVDVKPKDGDDRASMFMELYKISANLVQYVVNKENSLVQLEADLSDMHSKFTSIRTDSRRNFSLSAWDLAGLKVEELTEPAVVMHDETYLVKMNERLLSSVLKQPSSNLLSTLKTPERDDGICPRGFAERVIKHFGRQIPVHETAKPILQTSQTEQIKELLDRKTEYLASKVDKIEEVQKAMQTSHHETAQKLEQILSLLLSQNKRASSPPPSDGYFLSSYEEQ